jgi:deoxyribodipyrimidine photo-lyase
VTTPVIVWFRQDLRLVDHPALAAAAATGRPVIPVYVWAPDDDGDWPPGAASRVWLHHSLNALASELARLDARLIVRSGDTVAVLQALCTETGADAVYCHRRIEPAARKLGQRLQTELRSAGINVSVFDAGTLFRSESLTNRSGQPYKVFTAFWKHCLSQQAPSQPLPSPKTLVPPETWPDSTPIAALELLPRNPDWAGGIHGRWRPGTQAAEQRLAHFIEERLDGYTAGRDQPAMMPCRACRRACISVNSAYAKSGIPCGVSRPRRAVRVSVRRPMRFCASWVGASLPCTCCITSRTA